MRRIYARSYNAGMARLFHLAGVGPERSGRGSWVYGDGDAAYLDFATSFGVFALGHGHEAVQAAFQRQLEELPSAPDASEPRRRLERRLGEVLPGDLEPVALAGSGSEATEHALRIVRQAHPGRRRLVSATLGYHGKTLGALGLIGQPHLRRPFEPLGSDVHFVPYGELEALEAVVNEDVAAVFLEPVLAGNELIVPPRGYLEAARRLCDAAGALLVVDEVQTAFGRTGRLFGVEHDGVVPDLLVFSKALTGGCMPFAATAARRELWRALPASGHDRLFASDSAGGPLVCAVAEAALETVVAERLSDRAAALGPRLQAVLERAASEHPRLVVEASGRGLMAALRLRSPAVESFLWLAMLRRGVLTGLSLNTVVRKPVLRFYPPLSVSPEEIDTFGAALQGALEEIERIPAPLLAVASPAMRHQAYLPLSFLRAARRLVL